MMSSTLRFLCGAFKAQESPARSSFAGSFRDSDLDEDAKRRLNNRSAVATNRFGKGEADHDPPEPISRDCLFDARMWDVEDMPKSTYGHRGHSFPFHYGDYDSLTTAWYSSDHWVGRLTCGGCEDLWRTIHKSRRRVF